MQHGCYPWVYGLMNLGFLPPVSPEIPNAEIPNFCGVIQRTFAVISSYFERAVSQYFEYIDLSHILQVALA